MADSEASGAQILSGPLIIKAHRPGRTALMVVVAVIAVVAVGAGLLEVGQIRGGFNREQAVIAQELLQQQLLELEQQNTLLRDRVALLEESSRIDHEATVQLRMTLEAQDQEIMDLRQELAFYRGIVSPADGRAGLRLQRFSVQPRPSGEIGYELVLIQALRHDSNQSGQVRIVISGTDAAGPVELALATLSADGQASIPYNFRYFLTLTGLVTLPEGFAPEGVRVTLDPAANGQPNVEQSYNWADLVQGST
jgi:Family of unknown function (DUF6776)